VLHRRGFRLVATQQEKVVRSVLGNFWVEQDMAIIREGQIGQTGLHYCSSEGVPPSIATAGDPPSNAQRSQIPRFQWSGMFN